LASEIIDDKWFTQKNSMLFIKKQIILLKKTTLQQEFGLAAREKQ
jgi:hypothetical protein